MPVNGSLNTTRPCGVADEQPASQLSSVGTGESDRARSFENTVRWSRNDALNTIDSFCVELPHDTSYFCVKPSPAEKPPVYADATAPLNSLRVMMLMTPAIASEP